MWARVSGIRTVPHTSLVKISYDLELWNRLRFYRCCQAFPGACPGAFPGAEWHGFIFIKDSSLDNTCVIPNTYRNFNTNAMAIIIIVIQFYLFIKFKDTLHTN